MEQDFSFLTERQRMAYLLRQQGWTYKKIAIEMGITSNVARQNVLAAERRIREFEEYHAIQQRRDLPIEFSLTRRELEEIIYALSLLEQKLLSKSGGSNVRRDWKGYLPYRAQVVDALYLRAQKTLYGRIWDPGIIEK